MVLAVVAVGHLPVMILGILGHRPPMVGVVKAYGITAYLVLATLAVCRCLDYRARLLVGFLVLYPGLTIVNLGFPQGPYAQIGMVTLPIFALVLLGPRAGGVATVTSALIVATAPLLRMVPQIVHALGIDLVQVTDPFGLRWFRIAVKTVCLLGLMVLLARFHHFLLDTLRQRIAAQQKMEDEMNERHRLTREIAKVSDSERQRLGQELHDGVCQQVTAALLRCQALERRLERGGDLSGADFGPLSSLLSETIDDAHNVARGLCPLEPHPEALAPALRMLTVRTQEIAGVRCEFKAIGDVRVFDPEAAQHLYRIAQEALSNAVRHANPRRIGVELRGSDGTLILQIEDDGTGLPDPVPVNGMGLRTMSYRAQIISGELTVAPAPVSGTRVSCCVPVADHERTLVAGHCA
ncbi:MAG TPA: sensor histidine kinase [Terriglobales bacterium]